MTSTTKPENVQGMTTTVYSTGFPDDQPSFPSQPDTSVRLYPYGPTEPTPTTAQLLSDLARNLGKLEGACRAAIEHIKSGRAHKASDELEKVLKEINR